MQPQELRKVAEGREAEMFAWEGGTILRLLRDPDRQAGIQREAAAMTAASDRGVRVPAVHGLTTVEGRPGMIMERIDGPDLLGVIASRPWTVFRAGRICGEVHAQLHGAGVSSRLPPLRATIWGGIESSSRIPEELAQFALGILNELPDGDSLCHGDFHPANILMAGDTPVIIDWTNATRGDPAADVARSLVLLRMGEPPPGSSLFLRLAARVARGLLTSAYLRSYRRARPLDMAVVERWVTVRAAERLATEAIEEETAGLLKLLEERRARAAGT
jgi:aminoglycoside phosphotransferase (APT) family kinase protein